jgi:hypothetical protein
MALLSCGFALLHCGGEVADRAATAGANAAGGNAGSAAENGGSGCVPSSGTGSSGGELSAYEKLRTACTLETKVNRRGAPLAGQFGIK